MPAMATHIAEGTLQGDSEELSLTHWSQEVCIAA
jgi:hypothetical protein